ncbi:MAG: hypothetical protein WDN25_23590 [Acetobacteraceae bacterium]
MPELNFSQLRDLATRTDAELFVGKRDGNEDDRIYTQEGSLGGRMIRNLKVALGSDDRAARQSEYGEAKEAVKRAMVEAFGEDLGTKAFQAGIGRIREDGNWSTDDNFPITGRHIAKMLDTARDLVGGEAQIATWMEGIRGRQNDTLVQVELGEKVSQPLGQVPPDVAFNGLQTDLLNDLQQLPDFPPQHFWMVDVALTGGRHETIALCIDKENPDKVQMRDREGRTHEVDSNAIGARLHAETSRWLSFGVESISLHRINETAAQNVDLYHGQGRPLNVDIEHDCNFEMQDDRLVADARPLIDNLTWNNQIVNGFRYAIANDDRLGTTRLQQRADEGTVRVSLDGNEPQPIENAQGLFAVNTPNEVIFLDEAQRENLARFAGGIPMDETFGAIVGDEQVVPSNVDVHISANRDDDGALHFDLTFRARLPEGVVFRSGEDVVNGEDCDLVLTMHVPESQLAEGRPTVRIDNPQIELRPDAGIDELDASDEMPKRPVGLADITTWMNRLHGNDDAIGEEAPQQVRLGEKVSQPRGQVSLDAAFRGLQSDLLHDAQQQLDLHDSETWIVNIETNAGEQPIGLHISSFDRTNVEILGPDGSTTAVPVDRLAAELKAMTEPLLAGGVRSLALHRAG